MVKKPMLNLVSIRCMLTFGKTAILPLKPIMSSLFIMVVL